MNSIRELLFNTPWWMLGAVFVVGVAVWWSGNNRQRRSLKTAGLIVLGVGLAWALANYFVDTPVEKVTRGTREFVNAVVRRDRPTMDRLLHPKATLYQWDRTAILDGAIRYADEYGLRSAHITQDEVLDPPQAGMVTVLLTVFSNHESATIPVNTINSSWSIDWWETEDGRWQIKDIHARKVGTFEMDEVNRRFFSGRPR
jgi:hypothetical protein